jgi:cytochrome c biogenesis protein CcmG/thiol:disulfide interchange protein DsbE
MRRLILFVPLAVFVLLAAFLWKGLSLDPQELPSALIGKPFPDFKIPSLQQPDKFLTRTDLLGKPVLINVWATWCPACRQEHAELLAIARDGRIGIIGLNYKDERSAAIDWLQQLGNPYLFNIYDQQGRLGLDLGVYGAPETYLVDAAGIIRFRHVGVVTPEVWSDIKARLDKLDNPG